MRANKCFRELNLGLTKGLLITLIVAQVFGADTTAINETNLEQPSKVESSVQEPTVIVSQPARLTENVVINSIDDGLLGAGKGASERHHYEQQPEQVADIKPNPMAHIDDVDLYHGPIKPEPRNHQDEPQQQDPAIIDHRPNPADQQQQQQPQNLPQQQQIVVQEVYASTTQAPQIQQQQNQGNTIQTYVISQPSSSLTNQQHQQQPSNPPQQLQLSTSAASSNWHPQQTQHTVTFAQQPTSQPQVQGGQQVVGGQQYTIVAQASNQIPTIVQHPTSINSIINEHHQQQQQQQQLSPVQANQLTAPAGPLGQATPIGAASGNQQMVSVNGQPMILMNPNAITNNGRRISISGWLKGISSMLASIFNRREHGTQMMGQSSAPVGHWIQLGSGSPHWLSTAQTVAQQAQFHTQQQQFNNQQQSPGQILGAATTRYTTYIQAPTVQQAQSQQQPAMTLSLQAAPNNPQQQQQFQQNNDLQASGSSSQYITVAPTMQQQQHQQQNLVAIGQYAPPAASSQVNSVLPTPSPTATAIGSQQSQQTSANQTPARHVTSSNSQTSQIRFGRSSAAGSSSSSSGLPLAHYSRYALSSD